MIVNVGHLGRLLLHSVVIVVLSVRRVVVVWIVVSIGFFSVGPARIVHDPATGFLDYLGAAVFHTLQTILDSLLLFHFSLLAHEHLISSSILTGCGSLGLLHFLFFLFISFLVVRLDGLSFNLEIFAQLFNSLDELFTFSRA